MRYLLNILLMICVVLSTYASDIECVGSATQVINGKDTLFVFKEEIHLRSTVGNVDWYSTDGTPIASNTDEIYPDEGAYYIVTGTRKSIPVYVFLYKEIDPNLSLSIQPECESTTLTLTGNVEHITYKRMDGTTGIYERECIIHYNALAWNTEEWVDSTAQVLTTLHTGDYDLPPLYGPTPITLCYDATIRAALGMDSICIEAELLEAEVKAVKLELTSLATTRGKEGEKSNERNRPTSQLLIESSEYSGPLEVAFYSNPTPGVLYYDWRIYHGADLIITRNDKDIRYISMVSLLAVAQARMCSSVQSK